MGRPLKIKISDTQDAGFNNPNGTADSIPSGELFYGVLGGNTGTSNVVFPVLTARVFPASNSTGAEAEGFIVRQKGSSKFLVAMTTPIDPASAVVGQQIQIAVVGNTDWSAMSGDRLQGNIAVGLIFTVVAQSAAGSNGTANELGICTLANKADGALASGEMTMTYAAPDSSAVRIKRLSNRKVLDFSVTGTLYTPVVSIGNFFNLSDSTVVIGGSGSAASPKTRDLVQVENASLG